MPPSNDLPSSELAQIVGAQGMLALAEEFGGTRLYIPKDITANNRLAEILGVTVAKELSQRLGASAVRVPLMRDERALTYRGEGKSIAWIARKLCMTETGVDKLLARYRETSRAVPIALACTPGTTEA